MLRGKLLLGVLMDRRLPHQQFLAGLHCRGSCVHTAQEGLCSKAATCTSPVFSYGVPSTLLRERHAGHLTLHKVLVVQITAFLPSVEELTLLLSEEGVEPLRQA
jgi:hypothetical protein